MKSSSGAYSPGLDHVRALAAFLVFVWHFSHSTTGTPVPFNLSPEIGLMDEGHVGVALFMTLSGYLFAKLISGRVNYAAFLWNRAIRLLPLLFVVLAIVGIVEQREPASYIRLIIGGAILPQLPNGGWSITAEAHFYVLLPLLLWLANRRVDWLFLAIVLAILMRLGLAYVGLDLHDLAYKTIVGRFDQFTLGIAAFYLREKISGRIALVALVSLLVFYSAFDLAGGYYNLTWNPAWAFIPTIEGACFGVLIAWYDRHPLTHPATWIVRKAGEYSYSIYLLHFFVVFAAAQWIDRNVMALPTVYHALPWATLLFVFMIGVGHVSWKLIEQPFLKLRKPYLLGSNARDGLPDTWAARGHANPS